MLSKNRIKFLTTIFYFLFSNLLINSAFGQDTATKAFQLFDEKNYREAEPLFKQLIEEKPQLLMLYYYYGACRTENQKYSEDDLIQLLNANPDEAPAKINYYLGIQYQALNNWEQALKYYNKFKLNSTPEEQSDLKIAEKIQQCYNQENPYSELVIKQPTEITSDSVINIRSTDSINISLSNLPEKDTTINIPRDSINLKNITSENVEEISPDTGQKIELTINNQITYYNTNQFKTEEGRTFYEESQSIQNKLDSTLNKIDELRKKYLSVNKSTEKTAIGQDILTLENSTYDMKNQATQLLLKAVKAENEYWKNASEEEIDEFISENEKYQSNEENITEKPNQTEEKDSIPRINPSLILKDESDAADNEKPINNDLVYKIQIGAYSKGLPTYVERLYKRLSLIRKIDHYTDDRGVVVYTTGNLTNLDDALKMQKQVRQEGIEDAYVVPYFKGKRITLEEAKKIEGIL